MKNIIVFDLDGTLAESKASIDSEMANLLDSLLTLVKVSVISGGAWPQFEKQVVAHLRQDERTELDSRSTARNVCRGAQVTLYHKDNWGRAPICASARAAPVTLEAVLVTSSVIATLCAFPYGPVVS